MSEKQEQSKNENFKDDQTSSEEPLLDRLKETLNENSDLKLKIIQGNFNNDVLMYRIKVIENSKPKIHPSEQTEGIGNYPSHNDTMVNYNTKENYVEFLQERIRLLEDKLVGNQFSKNLQEQEKLKNKYLGLVENHKRLKKFYINLKERNKKYKNDADKFHLIIDEAKKSRKILEYYYRHGKIQQNWLKEIDLENPHEILSEEFQVTDADKAITNYDNYNKDRLIDLLLEAEKMVEQLQLDNNMQADEIKMLKLTQVSEIEKIKNDNDNQMKIIRIKYEQEIQQIQKKLVIKMKRQKMDMEENVGIKQTDFDKIMSEHKKMIEKLQEFDLVKNQLQVAKTQLAQAKNAQNKYQNEIEEIKSEKMNQQNNFIKKMQMQQKMNENISKNLEQSILQEKRDEIEQQQMVENLIKQSVIIQQQDQEVMDQYNQLKIDFEQINQELSEQKQTNNKLTNELDKIKQDLAEFESYKKFASDQMNQSHITLADMIDQLKEIGNKNNTSDIKDKEIQILKEEKEQLEDRIKFLEGQNTNMEQELLKNKEEIEQTKLKIVDSSHGQNEKKKQLQMELEAQKQRIESFEKRENSILILIGVFKGFADRNNILFDEKNPKEIEQILKDYENKYKELKNENELLNEKTAFYKKESSEQNDIMKSNLLMISQINSQDPEVLKKELENRKKDIKYLKKEVGANKEMINDLKSELERKNKRINLLEDEKTKNLIEQSSLQQYKQLTESQLQNQSQLLKLNQQDPQSFARMSSQVEIERKEKRFFKDQFEKVDSLYKYSEKEKLEMAAKIQELTVQQYYNKMIIDQQEKRIKEHEQIIQDVKNDFKIVKIENDKIKDHYERLQKSIEQEDFKNPEKTVKFQSLLKENEFLKDRLSQQNSEINKLNLQIIQMEKDLNDFREKDTQSNDKLKLKQLREKLRERDIEIIELIKASNQKDDQMKIIREKFKDFQFRDQIHQLDITVRDNHINLIKEDKETLKENQKNELDKKRQKYNIQQTGVEEIRILYQKLDELSYKIDEMKNLSKSEGLKSSPIYVELQLKVKELEQQLKIKDEILLNNKFKLENANEFLNDKGLSIQNLVKKVEQQLIVIQEQQGKLGEFKFQKEILQKQIQDLKSQFDEQRVRNQENQEKYDQQNEKINEYKVALNDLENKIRRLQERVDQQSAELILKEGVINSQKKDVQRLEEELINSAELFINKAQNLNQGSFRQKQIVNELEEQILDYKNKYLQQQKDYNSLKTQYEQDMKNHMKINEDLNQKIAFYKERLQLSPEQLKNLDNEDKLLNEIQQLQQIIRQYEEPEVMNEQEKSDQFSVENSLFSHEHQKVNQIYGTVQKKKQNKEDHELCQQRMQDLRKQIQYLESQNNLLQNSNNRYLDMVKDKNSEQEGTLQHFYTNVDPLLAEQKDESKFLDLQKKHKKVLMNLQEIQKDNYQLRDKVLNLEQEVSQKQKELQEQLFVNHELEQQKEIANLNKEGENKVIQLLEDKDIYYQKILKMNENEIQRLKNYQVEVDELKEENNKMNKEIQSLKIQLQSTESKYKSTKKLAEEIQQKYDKLQKSHKSQESILQECQNENIKLNEQIKMHIEQLNDIQRRKQVLEEQVIDLEQIVSNREKKIEELDERLQDSKQKSIEQNISNEEIKVIMRKKDREIRELQEQIEKNQDLEVQMNGLKRQILEEKEIRKQNEVELLDIKLLVSKHDKEKIEIDSKMEQAKSSLTFKDNKIDQLNKDLINQQQLVEKLQFELALIKKELQSTVDQLRIIDKQQEQQQEEFEQEYTDLKTIMIQKINQMKVYQNQTEAKMANLKKENEILSITNEALHKKLSENQF